MRDEGGMTFGVWLGEEGVKNGRGRGYYGSGESYVFSFLLFSFGLGADVFCSCFV